LALCKCRSQTRGQRCATVPQGRDPLQPWILLGYGTALLISASFCKLFLQTANAQLYSRQSPLLHVQTSDTFASLCQLAACLPPTLQPMSCSRYSKCEGWGLRLNGTRAALSTQWWVSFREGTMSLQVFGRDDAACEHGPPCARRPALPGNFYPQHHDGWRLGTGAAAWGQWALSGVCVCVHVCACVPVQHGANKLCQECACVCVCLCMHEFICASECVSACLCVRVRVCVRSRTMFVRMCFKYMCCNALAHKLLGLPCTASLWYGSGAHYSACVHR